MKLAIFSITVILAILAGIAANLLIPLPIIRTSAQPTGSSVYVDYIKTSVPGYLTVSLYGPANQNKIGHSNGRLEPGEYYNLPISIVDHIDSTYALNRVFVSFDPDRNNNNSYDDPDVTRNPLIHWLYTKPITRW